MLSAQTMKNNYFFDLDEGYPYFTKKNLLLVDALIRYNSDYSVTSDTNHPEYKNSYAGILTDKKDKFFNFDGDDLENVVKSINKINSTHLMSEGNSLAKGAKHDGISKTVNRIKEINNLKSRMIKKDPQIVFEIASAVDTKYNFSFATKFCTYVSELALNINDGYCIYDDVVQAILPLYISRYISKEKAKKYFKIVNANNPQKRRIESIVSEFKSINKKDGYEQYRNLIDEIIVGIEKKDKIKITYSEFDHMLWYYFKGSILRIQEALNTLDA